MDNNKKVNNSHNIEVRKGPWTIEEDLILINYIANHGEGVWNSLARSAGLKRTGKSCRLRWLNYLRPDVRRGNITPEEELLIMELHAKWGNRWSKIAKHLPGRTDNEIKNYWRTRIQKHTKQVSESSNNSSHSRQSYDNNKMEQPSSSTQIYMTCESSNPTSYITQNINHLPYSNNNNLPSLSTSSTSYHPEQEQQQQQPLMDNNTYNIMINSNIIPAETHAQQFWPTTDEDLWSMQLFNGN